ncbi:neuropeptide B-like [Erpetoichthys calabaricus]|uniref:neuropeptide B-like n=1 Tax=Erpetoichthys calabaricus TaxID=27687 RepID=UPI00223433E7|nr:neuropeptide B-like [Erpetoichthys calabaricus]
MNWIAAALMLGLTAVFAPCPPVAQAWYRQSSGPSAYSVGRASGLLLGLGRSHANRRGRSDEGADLSPFKGDESLNWEPAEEFLKSDSFIHAVSSTEGLPWGREKNFCLKDLTLHPTSCVAIDGDNLHSQTCTADVRISTDVGDCLHPRV